MALNNSLSSRLEELRSRNPQSPPEERTYSGHNTPSRYSGSFMPSHSQPLNDSRASLQRRFTTDSSKMPILTPIGQQPSQVPESTEISSSAFHKVQLLEKKRMEYELLREQRRRFDAELEKFNAQQAREKEELEQMAQDLQSMNLAPGNQSEPTTPPEYRDSGYTSLYSRRNRFSSASLASPPSYNNRTSRPSSQLISPTAELPQVQQAQTSSDKLPSKSVPGSRRGSNDRVTAYLPENGISQRSKAATNRYSMPAINRKRESVPEYSSIMGVGHINTTGFLFGDDDEKSQARKESTTSPDVKSYLQMNATDDKFPILVRRDDHPGLLSASSAALDLALSQSPGPDSVSNGWTPFARHRPSQNSLPQTAFDTPQSGFQNGESSNRSSQHSIEPPIESPTTVRSINRHSMEAVLASYAQKSMLGQAQNESGTVSRPSLANMQSSYSTNDLPTMKSTNGFTNGVSHTVSPPKSNAEQQFHNHNASLGRIPTHAMNSHHSRELSGGDARRDDQSNSYQSIHSALQASAAPFGPSMASTSSAAEIIASTMSPGNMSQYVTPSIYGGYGMQLTSMGVNPLQMGNPMAFNAQLSAYAPQNPFASYQQYNQPARFPDSQARVIQQRRLQNSEESARFTNVKLENLQGQICMLCKDQHGCRYLQKTLDERNPEHVHMIFMETNQHVVELMTDPFGNYLCQKLLEYSNDDQRTVLINNAAPQMVKIALNQHGTRALQKMIEFISTREQIQMIIYALKDRVVELIQDLNGNHVIQKCLNRLAPEDAQFIFDAVGANCVVVGTHRHGCCVLQRCIDHATGHQKAKLIAQITTNAYSLVQDPFGNYVLQYIVDLGEMIFTQPLCISFQGSIPALSKQKFSSNVIEKCLRGSDSNTSRIMIEEMLNANELEKMLRDSFANYVVQTALDYADTDTKNRLIEAIRPILPSIRQTPYGRRIQSKILGVEGRNSGIATPNDVSSPGQIPLGRQATAGQTTTAFTMPNGFKNTNGPYIDHMQNSFLANGSNNTVPYNPSINGVLPVHSQNLSNGSSVFNQYSSAPGQNSVHQPSPSYDRAPQSVGFNYF